MLYVPENLFDLKAEIHSWKEKREIVGFIPTMGNLHNGHLSLISEIKKYGATKTIVSIFVNPTQFGPGEDFKEYPRTIESDIKLLEKLEVDCVFCPDVKEIYQGQERSQIVINNPSLMGELCGKYRPGHFNGVLLVVNKLLNIIQPDMSIFGQKDYQQFILIKDMVRQLFMPVDIIMAPIIREYDGLAMSSRNSYLNQDERSKANKLYVSLSNASKKLRENHMSPETIVQMEMDRMSEIGLNVEYFELRKTNNLSSIEVYKYKKDEYVLLGAVKLGTTRLIDNIIL